MPLKILKNTLFILFSFYSLTVFGLFVTNGIWLSSNRPDQIDSSVLYMAGQILHKGDKEKIYNFDYQKQYAEKLFLKFIPSKLNTSKPSYLSSEQFYQKYRYPKLASLYYYYPPNSLLFLYLLTFFNASITYLSIVFLTLFMLFVAFYRSKILENVLENKWYLVSIFCFFPFLSNIFWGQITLVIYLCFYFYYYFKQKNKSLISAFFLALCLIKPQIGLPLLFVPILQKDFKTLGLSLAWTALFCAISFCFIGLNGFIDYLNFLFNSFGVQTSTAFFPPPIKSVSAFVHYLGVFQGFSACNLNLIKYSVVPFSLLVFASAVYLNKKEEPDSDLKIAKWLLLFSLLNIYVHKHYYTVLIVASIFAFKKLKHMPFYFPVICSFLPSLLELLIGDEALVVAYNLHLYWLLNILTIFIL